MSSQCSPLPSSLTSPLESLSSLYTEDHCHSNRRHTFYYDPLFASTIEIVFFRSTSSKKNRRHRTYHAPSCAAQVNCIKDMRHMCLHAPLEDSTSSSTCHTRPRAHAPTCLTRPMRPRDLHALHASHALHVPRSSSNLLTSSVMSSCLRQPPWQPSAYVIIRVILLTLLLCYWLWLLTFEEGWSLTFSRVKFLQSRCSLSIFLRWFNFVVHFCIFCFKMKSKYKSSFYCNNRRRQSNKHFYKRLGHNIETCY